MVIFQVIVNVGMCLFVMPVIGLTLPFISYGGSSLLMLFISMGLVSGVQGRSKPGLAAIIASRGASNGRALFIYSLFGGKSVVIPETPCYNSAVNSRVKNSESVG